MLNKRQAEAPTDTGAEDAPALRSEPSPQKRTTEPPLYLSQFAGYFKRYMSVSAVVTAALPVPATSLHWIPTWGFQTQLLSVYTPLFCFLVLTFIFYQRHTLARRMFPEFLQRAGFSASSGDEDRPNGALRPDRPWMILDAPRAGSEAGVELALLDQRRGQAGLTRTALYLILASIGSVFIYQASLTGSVVEISRDHALLQNIGCMELTNQAQCILERTDLVAAAARLGPGRLYYLLALYLAIFACAESAFVLMALKEYLQVLLHYGEVELIEARRAATSGSHSSENATRVVPEERDDVSGPVSSAAGGPDT